MTASNDMETIGNPTRRAGAANPVYPGDIEFTSFTGAITDPLPQLEVPVTDITTGSFVVPLAGKAPLHIALMLGIKGLDNVVVSATVYRWNRWRDENGVNLFVPQELVAVTGTSGVTFGVVGHQIDETTRFADIFAVVSDSTRGSSAEAVSGLPVGHVSFDGMGGQYLEVRLSCPAATSATIGLVTL